VCQQCVGPSSQKCRRWAIPSRTVSLEPTERVDRTHAGVPRSCVDLSCNRWWRDRHAQRIVQAHSTLIPADRVDKLMTMTGGARQTASPSSVQSCRRRRRDPSHGSQDAMANRRLGITTDRNRPFVHPHAEGTSGGQPRAGGRNHPLSVLLPTASAAPCRLFGSSRRRRRARRFCRPPTWRTPGCRCSPPCCSPRSWE